MKKKPAPLKKTELNKFIKQVPLWNLNPKATALTRTFTFTSHLDALVFIARVTVHAQVLDHHPEILFSYQKVKITQTTHDAKGLTKRDFDLIKRIDSLKYVGG